MEVPQESKRQEKKIEYVNENAHNKKFSVISKIVSNCAD